ncbi:MAG TPA: FAD-dependent oxidoreductase [Actinomycetota bacterium]
MTDGPVVVVGGGLVGLSCAWFLRAAGADVTVLEAGRPGGGASRGNAGAICPSMAEPLPAPGMIREALADLARPDAALHVHPAYAPRMARFLTRFAAAATAERHERGLAALAQLGRGATAAFDELAAAGIGAGAQRDGYLFVHGSRGHAERERAAIARMSALGLCEEPGPVIGGAELRALEPLLGKAALMGFLAPGERWIDPSRFVDELAAGCAAAGVEMVPDAAAARIEAFDDGVEVETVAGRFDGATAVVAAGVWTRELLVPLGLRLPIHPGKGYSFAVRPSPVPRRAMHLSDAHVMAAPMGERLRVAGTMEFDGTTDRFNPRRIEAIVRAAGLFLDVDLAARSEEWVGPRPITPDGLPFLGPVPDRPRVVVAAGHNMLGLTLAPVTGRAIAGLVTAGDPGIDVTPFAPDRY